ncbi:MAG: VWA domain-containing protein, partial [Clostridia bacterium]|nr:VWA domain-containing protein [Clostridia bacterium]
MKKILTLFLAILMLIGTVPLVVSADDTQPPSTFEVVLLLDTSGSMVNKEWDGGSWVGSDPEMISIEAAKAFASYYPSSAKYFNVSIVLYNSAVMVGLKNVNVANPENIEPYNAFLDEVKACTGNSKNAADKAFVGKYGFSCWTGDTDIGSAMVAAQSILDASSAEKKAVILFSDGKIDLSGENSAEKEAASEKAAFDSAKHFAETDTVVYTIGLSKTADGVDREFMQKLADDTNGEFRYCQDANKVFGFFQDMYTDFIEGTIREEEEYEVLPDVPVSHSMNIYGQVISEMNLVLFSDTPIKTYTVTNPNGVVVAELKANGKESTSSGCIIHRNERTVTVKLITPTDGNWSINFTSSSVGTVKVREIFSYSLDVQSDTPEQV